ANSWSMVASSGAPEGRTFATAVWTGSRMIVWGGEGVSGNLSSGGLYDPVKNKWTLTPTTGAPDPRRLHTAVWTGSEMGGWGGQGSCNPLVVLASGGRYDPVANAWTPTPSLNAPSARQSHSAVWTGSLMVVWGGESPLDELTFWDGGRFDPISGTWTPI